MIRFLACLVISLVLHNILLLVLPLINFKADEPIVVTIETVRRTRVNTTGRDATQTMPAADPVPVATPTPPPPAQTPTPTPPPQPPARTPEPVPEPVAQPEPTAEPAPVAVEDSPSPTVEPNSASPTPAETPPASEELPRTGDEAFSAPNNTADSTESTNEGETREDTGADVTVEPAATDAHAENTPAPTSSDNPSGTTEQEGAAEPEPEELDGRATVFTVQNFVSDRIQGQIEFKGKSRKLVSTPGSPDFSLSNNTSVQLSFMIDQSGQPYDVDIPPVPVELERMLNDFVKKMRFSAVLYSEPDMASMKVDLNVR